VSEGRFAGRGCVVTGSTGLAASGARALAAEGGHLFVISRDAGHARALADEITDAGGSAEWHAADLRGESGVEAAFGAAASSLGRIDALYAVAGISARRFGDGPIHEASLVGWDAAITANATSMFLVCRAAVVRMQAQAPDADGLRGAIVTMSSVLARHPSVPHFETHGYAASKGAIEALTRSMAASYAPHGIRVNAIAPGLVATPMSGRAQDDPETLAYLRAKQPLAGGPMEPATVTPTALHLLSRDARMITGQVIDVDGGWGVSEPATHG
jgi:NAD(P)-dependent dehydrogenase (short-subunit alcohol dehydrogenase family)